MKLSIVMPVFHAEDYIREHLARLLANDLGEVQLVIVVCEDGYDKSAEICAEMVRDLENVSLIVQEDEGLSVARNTGLLAASGEYIFFMDSDDILLEQGFSELMQLLRGTLADVIVCKFVLLQEKGRDVWPAYRFPELSDATEVIAAIYADLPDSVWNVWRYVCRKEFLLDNDLFFVPGLICEDVEWTPRMLEAARNKPGGRIIFFNAPLYGYCYNRSGQLSSRISVKRTIDINRTASEGIALYKDKPYGQPLCYRLIRESFHSISEYCRFKSADRKEIRPYIDECMKNYNLSPNKAARICAATAQKCVFIDRDGTVNAERGLISRPEDFELLPTSADAIRMLNTSGFLAVVVTNQPVVARGLCSIEDVDEIHRKMATLLGQEGAYLDAVYFCPHHPDRGYPEENPLYKVDCDCRKPGIGMIRRAMEEFNISPEMSWMIGDTTRDVQTGKNAGLKTVLVRTGSAGRDGDFNAVPDMVCEDLADAVQRILPLTIFRSGGGILRGKGDIL